MMPCSSLPIPGNPVPAHPSCVHFCASLSEQDKKKEYLKQKKLKKKGKGADPLLTEKEAAQAARTAATAPRLGEASRGVDGADGLVGCRMGRAACWQAGLCWLPGRQHSCTC